MQSTQSSQVIQKKFDETKSLSTMSGVLSSIKTKRNETVNLLVTNVPII